MDGQTSTALLVQALQALGADVVYYIPIRGKRVTACMLTRSSRSSTTARR
ncbi:MAG: hypothetical protein IPN96_11990 [Anaerolineales bacterium]|nr:hypothetical protein [Anaerolineales bacterium]